MKSSLHRLAWNLTGLLVALLLCTAPAKAQRVPEVDDVYASGQVLRALGPIGDSAEALSILKRAGSTAKTLRFDFTLTQVTYNSSENQSPESISGTVALELDDPRQRMHITYRRSAADGTPMLGAAQRDDGKWTLRVIDDPSLNGQAQTASPDSWFNTLDLSFLFARPTDDSQTALNPTAPVDLTAGSNVVGHWTAPLQGQHHYMTFDPKTAMPIEMQIWSFSERGLPLRRGLELRQFQINPPLPKPALFPRISR